MVRVSPLATPSSMIDALTVGKYSDARLLISCSSTTTAISHRYGRTYWRRSAKGVSLPLPRGGKTRRGRQDLAILLAVHHTTVDCTCAGSSIMEVGDGQSDVMHS